VKPAPGLPVPDQRYAQLAHRRSILLGHTRPNVKRIGITLTS
jgi:hypothetical protein